MKSVIEDIKNQQLKQVYLLYGDETYLKKQYRDKLHEAVLPADDTMNYTYFEGKGTAPGEVIDLAETMPFFAEHRLIVIENSGWFKTSSPQMAEYIKELPEFTYFVFVEEEVDKRNALFKAVKEKGRAAEMTRQDERTLIRWVAGMLKKEQKSIRESTLQLFLSKTGSDMENICQELEKLVCYTMDRPEINDEDVEEICTTQIANKIFDMIGAVTEQNQKKALKLYYDLLALKEPPMRILFLISRQFNQLMQVKNMKTLGLDSSTIAKQAGLAPFLVKKYAAQTGRFTLEQLREAVEDCAQMEEAVKTGQLTDTISVELLIVKYSAMAREN